VGLFGGTSTLTLFTLFNNSNIKPIVMAYNWASKIDVNKRKINRYFSGVDIAVRVLE
jgi:hypothetical protein